MRKNVKLGLIIGAPLLALITSCTATVPMDEGVDPQSPSATAPELSTATPIETTPPAPAPAETTTAPAPEETTAVAETQDSQTGSQRNAVAKAEQYLSSMAFSASGLQKQLEFEGFSSDDATYAIENIDVDWNAQAAKKAAQYQDIMPMSRQGLIDQLKFEGFSADQAEYGVANGTDL